MTRREVENAESLRWQGRFRAAFVGGLAALGVVFRHMGWVAGSAQMLALLAAAYLLVVLAIQLRLRRRTEAPDWLVVVTIGADLAFIFLSTLLATAPAHYERALFLSLFTLQLTDFHFGRLAARWALGGVAGAYVAMLAAAHADGVVVAWMEEMWLLVMYLTGALLSIEQHGTYRHRLGRLVRLFERAEDGDFSGEYDVAADRRPDGITAVGRAYNALRAQLYTLVLVDPLSGCLNRRGLDQELRRTAVRAARDGREVGLVAVDIDFFKAINDTHGHLAGDAVIREVGALLRTSARAGDVVARTGGEEFMILLPDTGAEAARMVAERIVAAMRAHRFAALGDGERVTLSAGVAVERATTAGIAEDLRSRADKALYRAKRSGRDRVCEWEPGMRVFA